jgi:hypothetical protein
MGTLPEITRFDETVYELETGDDVAGGPNGALNLAAKALANRTQYLKTQIDELNTAWETLKAAAFLDVGTTSGTVAAGNHSHSVATESNNGFMAAVDKTKLDGLAPVTMTAADHNFSGTTTTITADAGISSMLILTCDIVNGSADTLGLKVEVNGSIVYNKSVGCNYQLGWSPVVFIPGVSGTVTIKVTTIGGGTAIVGNVFSVAIIGTPTP